MEISIEGYYGGHPEAISDGSLVIGKVTYLVTHVVTLMVVYILGSTVPHCVAGGQMRLVERAMGGSRLLRVA